MLQCPSPAPRMLRLRGLLTAAALCGAVRFLPVDPSLIEENRTCPRRDADAGTADAVAGEGLEYLELAQTL